MTARIVVVASLSATAPLRVEHAAVVGEVVSLGCLTGDAGRRQRIGRR